MDFQLLNILSSRDSDAFDILIREYYPRLMGYACILLSEEDAKDVVQEVFLYVWEHRNRINFESGFQSYIFRTCHSRMVDLLKRRKLINIDDAPPQLAEDIKWLESKSSDIIRRICDKELLERVMTLSEELPEKRREVFCLSIFHDMSNAEISETLNMPRRTVEGHLYHALKFFRKRISTEELLCLMLAVTFLIK